jgi:hypothetical protein
LIKPYLQQFFVALLFTVEIFSPLGQAYAQNSNPPAESDPTANLGRPANNEIAIGFDPETAQLDPNNIKIQEVRAGADENAPNEDRREYSPSEIRALVQALNNNEPMIPADLNNSQPQARGTFARIGSGIVNVGKRVWNQVPAPKHFGIETTYFQIVLGAMAVQQTLSRYTTATSGDKITGYAQNPVAIEQLFDSLMDPVANLSFASFMVANGVTTDFLSDARLPWSTKKAYLRMILPGLGMTAGSVLSQLTGEGIQLFKACRVESVNRSQKEKALHTIFSPLKKEDDPCEAAWKMWTIEKKFYSYAPSITNMLLATVAGGAASWLVRIGFYTKKVNAATGETRLVANALLRKARIAAAKELTLRGFDWAVMFGRGGAVARTVKIVSKIGNISFFLISDHMLRDATNWVLGNVFRSGDVMGKLTRGVIPGKNFQEYGEQLNSIILSVNSEARSQQTLSFLGDFSQSMEDWRKMNNQDVEAAQANWQEKTMGFTTTSRTALDFYGRVIDDLKAVEEDRIYQASGKTGIPPETNWNLAKRTYPLYGVRPTAGTQVYPTADDAASDYLINPDRIEKYQMITVTNAAKDICGKKLPYQEQFLPGDFQIFNKVCAAVNSQNRDQIGQALLTVNRVVLPKPADKPDFDAAVSYPATDLLTKFRNSIGDPYPLFNLMEGLSYAFDVYPVVRMHSLSFPDVHMGLYGREKISDYMAFMMVCGTENPNDAILDHTGFKMRFEPPKIVALASQPSICQNSQDGLGQQMRSSMLYRQKITMDGKTYNGIGDIILSNLSPEMKDIISSPDRTKNINIWWQKRYGNLIEAKFHSLLMDYYTVQKVLQNNYYLPNSIFNHGVVSNALVTSMAQEARVNLMIQGDLLRAVMARQPSVIPAQELKGLIATEQNLKTAQPDAQYPIAYPAVNRAQYGDAIILQLQRQPWMLDYQAYKKNQTPKVFTFQAEAERLIHNQEAILATSLEPGTDKGRPLYNNNADLETNQEALVQSALDLSKRIQTLFNRFKLSDSEKKIVETTTKNLLKVINTTSVYISIGQTLKYESALKDTNVIKVSGAKKSASPVRGGN